MKSLQQCIDQMNLLANELIEVATTLRNMSQQVISEEDLEPLQQREEKLLTQLEELDHLLKKNYKNQLSPQIQEQMHQKLQAFQELNQEYIQNLNASHGLIQFELERIENQEAGDFSHLSRLNKRPISPDKSSPNNKI